MKLDFGSRPIHSWDYIGVVLFNAHGKPLAKAKITSLVHEDTTWTVYGKTTHGYVFLAKVTGEGNMTAVVSGHYDKLYPTPVWVVLATISDENDMATFSREVEARNYQEAREKVILDVMVDAGDEETIHILAVYGPYKRAS